MSDHEPRPLEPAVDAADYENAAKEVADRILLIHASIPSDRMPQWAVYGDRTKQHPGFFAARLWLALPTPEPTDVVMRAGTLEEIRCLLPPGLNRIPRFEQDDPDIVEVWL